MPHSIRTTLRITEKAKFERFLKINNLDDVLVGSYKKDTAIPGLPFGSASEDCLCYAYMCSNEDEKSLLSFMLLKYGNLENAFMEHKKILGIK